MDLVCCQIDSDLRFKSLLRVLTLTATWTYFDRAPSISLKEGFDSSAIFGDSSSNSDPLVTIGSVCLGEKIHVTGDQEPTVEDVVVDKFEKPRVDPILNRCPHLLVGFGRSLSNPLGNKVATN